MLVDAHGKPKGRAEAYIVWRIIERLGSPKDFLQHCDEFYDLSPDDITRLIAYMQIRDAEERVLSTRGF